MKYLLPIISCLAAFAAGVAACGEDTTATGATSGSQGSGAQGGSAQGGSAQGGSAQGGSAQGGSAQGGSAQGGSAQGGSGQGGGAVGCVSDPSLCPPNWECCAGVPYPREGQCHPECNLQSDRSTKHDIQPVQGDGVLETLASLPIARWRYDAAPGAQHMGPMAQDFHAAFGLGFDDRHIAAVDASGVALAAIQALHRRLEALQAQNEAHARHNAELRAELEALERSFDERCPAR